MIYDHVCDDITTDNKVDTVKNALSVRFSKLTGLKQCRPLTMLGLCRQIREEFIAFLIGRCGPVEPGAAHLYTRTPTLLISGSRNVRLGSATTKEDCDIKLELYDEDSKALIVTFGVRRGFGMTVASIHMIKMYLNKIIKSNSDLTMTNCFLALRFALASRVHVERRPSIGYTRYEGTEFRINCYYEGPEMSVREHEQRIC